MSELAKVLMVILAGASIPFVRAYHQSMRIGEGNSHMHYHSQQQSANHSRTRRKNGLGNSVAETPGQTA